MNDNIIKMFIGGEEVVSNKEFTINEEMLSASSTILNNCYPASWEETKDYVSNFYYPKDYSKYILGKGNFKYGTDRYTKLNVSGIFPTFETNTEKPFDEIQIEGKSEQATRSGKNLLENKTKNSGISRGITFTLNGDGSYTLNGTNDGTGNATVFLSSSSNPTTLKAGTYYTIPTPNGVQITGVKIGGGYFQLASSSINKFTLNEDTQAQIYIQVPNGITTTYNNIKVYPMISTTPITQTDYEPYGVMPSPDFPSEIESVGIYNEETGKYGIEVKNTGKNLFDCANSRIIYNNGNTSYERLTNGLKIISSGAQYNILYFLVDTVENLKGKTLTLSSDISFSKDNQLTSFGLYYTDTNGGNRTTLVTNNVTSEGKYQVTGQIKEGENRYYVCIGLRPNLASNFASGDYTIYNNLQVEIGETATEYEPYKSVSSLFTLNQPLRSLPNGVKDKLYVRNNKLYVERYVGSVVLDGSESGWTDRPNYNSADRFVIGLFFPTNHKNILSNYFTKVNSILDTYPYILNNDRQLVINFSKKGTTTLEQFKTWLSTHNTQVDYELAEPYTEKIGEVDTLSTFKGINNVSLDANMETNINLTYLWENYKLLFCGIVKNSGDISLRPTDPKYCSLQILDYKTFLSESDTLDFVISDKTIAQAISMVVDAISGYGFILGTINISQADDVIGAYSTLNKTAYDVFQYLANISGSRWRARFVDNDTMAIDFYDPELLPRANDIDYTQQYWEDNKIVDLTFNYGTRDYRNKQIILSDEVYGGIDYTEVLLSNGYGTSYITQNNIANITSITVNGVKAEVITQSEKDLGVDADFYYTPGKNVVESTTSYSAGTQIIITYTPLVKGRQIVYNDEEVTRIATQTNTTGVISRYENRNDILSSDELENIAETYIKYKGKPEIILKLTTLNNDLFNIGEICCFNSPIADLAQDYMVKSKATNYTSVAGETNIFYTYELTSSFNSEKAINYFDNQRNKTTGNIAEGESITRNIDINNSAMIIWENATITEISVSVDGDNALNSVLNSPFIQ